MLRFSSVLAAVVVVALPACPFLGSSCPDPLVDVRLVGQGDVPLEDATVTATSDGVERECPHIGDGTYACGELPAGRPVPIHIEGPGYTRDIDGGPGAEAGVCTISFQTELSIPEAAGPACCCASIVEGDIIEEAPADSTATCIAREQGHCVDQATIDQRLTPHACCSDATGERCGD